MLQKGNLVLLAKCLHDVDFEIKSFRHPVIRSLTIDPYNGISR